MNRDTVLEWATFVKLTSHLRHYEAVMMLFFPAQIPFVQAPQVAKVGCRFHPRRRRFASEPNVGGFSL
jgi:hypothetical protein